MRSLLICLFLVAAPGPVAALTWSGIAAPDGFGTARFTVPLPVHRSGRLDVSVAVSGGVLSTAEESAITASYITFYDFFDPLTGEPQGGNDTQVDDSRSYRDIFVPATATYAASFDVTRRIPYVVRVLGAPFPSETGYTETLVGTFGAFDTAVPIRWVVTASGPAAVPEPASWALLLAGFGAVGAALRRRQRPRPGQRAASGPAAKPARPMA